MATSVTQEVERSFFTGSDVQSATPPQRTSTVASPPEIVDHANRHLPDPNVVAVTIGPNDVAPSLQIKIGDLDVNESRVIHWVMQSSFQGGLETGMSVVQMDDLGGRYPLMPATPASTSWSTSSDCLVGDHGAAVLYT
jgi:hypothetical protein